MGSEGRAGQCEGGGETQGRRIKMKRKSCGSLTIGLTPPPTTLPGVHTPNTPEILNTIVSITTHGSHTPSQPWLCTTHTDAGVQGYRSQFIKEGLKMKVKKNMELVTEDSLHKVLSQNIKEEIQDLSPEDKTRRQRRRERNKVAAEKCRNKKKKETQKLFAESEMVERANACYKKELSRLKEEEKHLIKILETHKPLCQLQMGIPLSEPYRIDYNSGLEHECGKGIADSAGGGGGYNVGNTVDHIVHNICDFKADITGDYSIDNLEDNDDNIAESCKRDERMNYPSYFYPGYSSSGYNNSSACAAV